MNPDILKSADYAAIALDAKTALEPSVKVDRATGIVTINNPTPNLNYVIQCVSIRSGDQFAKYQPFQPLKIEPMSSMTFKLESSVASVIDGFVLGCEQADEEAHPPVTVSIEYEE